MSTQSTNEAIQGTQHAAGTGSAIHSGLARMLRMSPVKLRGDNKWQDTLIITNGAAILLDRYITDGITTWQLFDAPSGLVAFVPQEVDFFSLMLVDCDVADECIYLPHHGLYFTANRPQYNILYSMLTKEITVITNGNDGIFTIIPDCLQQGIGTAA